MKQKFIIITFNAYFPWSLLLRLPKDGGGRFLRLFTSGVWERDLEIGDAGLVGTDCILIMGGSGGNELPCHDKVSYNFYI